MIIIITFSYNIIFIWPNFSDRKHVDHIDIFNYFIDYLYFILFIGFFGGISIMEISFGFFYMLIK